MTIPIQLAIQGGGAKITYLLAALESVQALEREGRLRVTRIAGTSAGAIGICENLPAGELTNAPEYGEVVGITFSASRARAPLTSFAAFTGALRTMYERQHEPVRFEVLSVRMIVTGASQARAGRRGPDDIRHEIVFRASKQPIHCYRIKLTPAAAPELQKSQCEVFDRQYSAVAFDLVPIPDSTDDEREYLLFFREPIVGGDRRSPVTLRVRDAVAGVLCLVSEGHDELLTCATRVDRPVPRVEIVVHLPEELSGTSIVAAPGPEGAPMSPAELILYAAPAKFFTLGWRGDNVPPNTMFGCNLVRR